MSKRRQLMIVLLIETSNLRINVVNLVAVNSSLKRRLKTMKIL